MAIDPAPLPAPEPRFAHRSHAAPHADLYPMGTVVNGRPEQGHFIADANWETEIATKLDLLATDAAMRRCLVMDDPAGLAEALWRVAGVLAADEPALWQTTNDGATLPRLGLRLLTRNSAERIEPLIDASNATPLGTRVAHWLERQTGVTRLLDAVALACQEDIVIMRGTPGGDDVAEALHVCFPSGWDPREKVGTGFAAIHGPIAENERLIRSSPNVMKALLSKGPYVRFAWSVTLDPKLDHHPDVPRVRPAPALLADPEAVAAATYVRVERQTTFPMTDLGRGLFTIRVYVDPLLERLEREPGIRPKLISLLETATPAVRAYKGIAEITPPLLEWLTREPGPEPQTTVQERI
jgi:hypothetical protein